MRLILFLIPVLAFAQLDDNTITVTASRPVSVQPDQAVIGITVGTGTNATLDDVLATLKNVGITAANLTSVDTSELSPTNPVEWQFTIFVPLPSLNSTLATLASIHQNVGYYIQSTQVSPSLQAANPCTYPALLSDAQKQAQAFAQAAGATIGPIVAISDQPPGGALAANIFNPFTGAHWFNTSAFFAPVAPSSTCSLTVQFKLRRI